MKLVAIVFAFNSITILYFPFIDADESVKLPKGKGTKAAEIKVEEPKAPAEPMPKVASESETKAAADELQKRLSKIVSQLTEPVRRKILHLL